MGAVLSTADLPADMVAPGVAAEEAARAARVARILAGERAAVEWRRTAKHLTPG